MAFQCLGLRTTVRFALTVAVVLIGFDQSLSLSALRRMAPKVDSVVAATGYTRDHNVTLGRDRLCEWRIASGLAVPCTLSMTPGSVEIEARMPGYQTAKTTVNLTAGAHLPVPLRLTPVLALKLLMPSEARVAINNEAPVTVQDGQFFRDLPMGTYAVKVLTGRSGTIAFAFEVRPDGPAVISEPPGAQDVSALLISNFGTDADIHRRFISGREARRPGSRSSR